MNTHASFVFSEDGRIATIFGISYAVDLFKEFGVAPIGSHIEIVSRQDGVVSLRHLPPDSAGGQFIGKFRKLTRLSFDSESLTLSVGFASMEEGASAYALICNLISQPDDTAEANQHTVGTSLKTGARNE